MKRIRITLSVTVVIVALIVFGAGSYILKVNRVIAGAAETKAESEPNKPAEAEKPADSNAPQKAAEAEKPADPNDSESERPQRRSRAPREGGMGRSGFSPEDRERMEEMRARWENATDEEREELRAQMRERFSGRRPRGEEGGFGSERGFGGERRPGGRRRPRDPNDPNAPAEPNQPTEPIEPNVPSDPNKIMETINLRDVQMKDIIKKLAEWTGKVIIPADDAMNQKITIYSTKKLFRPEAITMIYTALRAKGIIAEQSNNVIELKSIKDVRLGPVPTVQADYALAMIENKKQVVQKFFKLHNYGPTQMAQVVQPLIGDYGYVSADETTGQLLVIDTVENLMRIERIIDQFDVPEAEPTVTKIIPVKFGDPSEIVQMLKILLGESEGYSTMRSNRFGRSDRDRRSGNQPSQQRPPGQQGGPAQPGDSKGVATSVTIESTRGPVVLIPEPRRKWIIAKASAADMKQLEEWITKLDMEEPVQSEYEVVQLRYADPREIEDSVGDGFRDLPGMEFLPSILIEPLVETKQVIVFGRKDLREIVKKMIQEIDVPPGQFETRHFKLKYADPDQIKANIDELYGEDGLQSSSRSRGYSSFYNPFSRRGQSSGTSSDVVKTISYISLKQVTVIASPENMIEIAEQIEKWDAPLDVNEVKPRIIELHNTDPVQMADLLTSLFSESSDGSSGRSGILAIIFGGQTEERQKIVGPLYGQLTFEAVPGTKKIIVISKIAEAYDVVESLIRDLDKAEMGEVPKVITLKYADPEDLAERLNAMFNEPGTTATIQRSDQGLSAYSMDSDSGGGGSSQTSQSTTSQGEYRPWWTTGRQSLNEMPISNVIGRIRFVPDPRTKSILILAPPEFMDNIVQLIEELDIPGKQVMIKAVIMQIDHSNVTSLGLQLSSGGFSDVGENAITIVNSLEHLQEHGSMVFGAGGTSGSTFGFSANLDVTTMIDFLVKKTNAKILNQQTLWTKDNEEAMFFKGKRVAFFTTATTSATAGNVQNFEFQQVGMTLRVRPSITPENNVDMIINVILSQLTSDKENNQPVRTEMDTTTNMIIQHAQTLMLGGILFQTDSQVERKIPVLGDVPVAGGLFRHNNIIESNEELIVFITPYVIDEPDKLLPETKAEIEPPLQKLETTKEELEAILGSSSVP